jgi:hypothetical protein
VKPALSQLRRGRGFSRLLAVAALLIVLGTGLAMGERSRKGDLIVALDGKISPLALPRDRPAPVAIHLAGGLNKVGGGLLPRVTQIELGLPAQGVLSTRGLPTCSQRRLRDTKPPEALAACREALIGRGRLGAQIHIPHQEPFTISARLLAFNGRQGGRRMVILHGYAANPPTVVVLPFYLSRQPGRFGLALTANLPRALGPWPRFADFEMTLNRRYSYRGKPRSYLSASCPIPPRNTAGFFSLAKMNLTLADGRRIGTGIARSCRAR